MAYAEEFFSQWRDKANLTEVVTSVGTVGATPPTLTASAGSFTLAFGGSGLNVGRTINFGSIRNAYNGMTVVVSFRMSGAIASSIDFQAGTANQITGSTNNSDGEYSFTCTLGSGYTSPEFTIYSTDANQGSVIFYSLRIQGSLNEIKIKKDGFGGSTTEIEKQQPVAMVVNRVGDKQVQINNRVRGSSLTFNYFVDPADVSTYDSMYESDFKDYKVEHYYNNTLEWVGYLLPENFRRDWIDENNIYAYSLVATDGLARLKEIEYKNFSTGAQYADRVSKITHIKRALEHLELELDFRVQLGTYATNDSLMTSSECILDKGTVDSGRFAQVKDGREFNKDCYTIIEEILDPFYCYLAQVQGYYQIINAQEKDSYYFPITWIALTVGTRTARDLTFSLADFCYRRSSELQKIRPIEEVQVTFRDRNVADNLLSNGDFSSGTTGWNKTGYFGSLTASSGYGEVPAVYALDTPPTYVYTDNESITQNNVDDQLEVTFKARITSFVGTAGTEPLMKVEIYQGANFVPVKSTNVFPLYESSLFTTYTVRFDLPVTAANYQLRIYTYARSTGAFTSFNFEFDDVVWVPIYADGEDLTFDRFYALKNSDNVFTDIVESEIFFGDSDQDNDIGSIQISGTRTETWNRYGKTDGEKIQVLHGQNILENFSRYKNYLRVTIFDPKYEIDFYRLLTESSRDYQILSCQEVSGEGMRRELVCELAEVLNLAVTSSVSTQGLTSVYGQSTQTVEVTVPPSGATPTLNEVTDEGSITTNSITVGGIDVGLGTIQIGNWDIQLNSNELEFEYNGTVVAKIATNGKIHTANDVEIFDTGL